MMVDECTTRADMQFSGTPQEEVLIAEMEEQDDALALQVHVIDADTQEVIGSANVELWTMVEDSIHLLRKVLYVLCSVIATYGGRYSRRFVRMLVCAAPLSFSCLLLS